MKIKSFPLKNFNQRPRESIINTVVIHSMYAKGQKYETSALACFKILDREKVSAHFSIDRRGNIFQHVDITERAWHAGESSLHYQGNSLTNFNDFSVGIELIAVWGNRFTRSQYRSLGNLLKYIDDNYPLKLIVSHQAIAPNRKTDPGPGFDWIKLKRNLAKAKITPKIVGD